MAISIVVPQLGESVAEGTVAKWLKAVGDKVRKEEPLVEIQTDKINVEIPSLSRSLIARGATVLPVADSRTHTTRVRLALPEATGLLPGQYARALFVTGRTRALAIPESAVLRRSEVTAV